MSLSVSSRVPADASSASQSWLSFRLLTGIYAGIVFGLVAMNLSFHGFNGDVLSNVSIGRWILAHGRIPGHNHWTQAMAGRPFSDTEWLFAVGLAWAYQAGGRLAVYALLLPFIAVTAGFIGYWAAQVGSWRGMIVATVAAINLMIVASPRPQWVSYAAFALGLWAIQQARQHHWRPLGLFLAIIPLWANAHASVVLAPALLLNETIWSPGRTRWRWAGATGLAALLTLVRWGGAASGSLFYAHVFTPGVLNVISEWQSPNFHTVMAFILLPTILLAWSVLLPWVWREKRSAVVLWVLLGPLVTLWAIRFAPYMVLGVVAALAESGLDRNTALPPRLIQAVLLTLVVAFNGLIVWRATQPSFFARRYPVQAVQYLAQHHAEGVVSWEQWGSALNFAGLTPWVNAQTQLWSRASWWMPFVQARHGGIATLLPWVHHWDPQARWILWPLAGYHTPQDGLRTPGWRLVYQERTSQGIVGVWHRQGS